MNCAPKKYKHRSHLLSTLKSFAVCSPPLSDISKFLALSTRVSTPSTILIAILNRRLFKLTVSKTTSPMASCSSNLPELPVELWEHIIDSIAGLSDYYGLYYGGITSKARKSLAQCQVVCRAWVPRCRLHLYHEVILDSRDALRFASTFLQASAFHARLVWALRIRGHGSDQSWISSAPFHLPKLPGLSRVQFSTVDFAQQHPRCPQAYSILRHSDHGESHSFTLEIDSEELETSPAQIASLVSALNAYHVQMEDFYPVDSCSGVARLNSWPRNLTARMHFQTKGSVQDLVTVLPVWTRPVALLNVVIESSLLEAMGQLWLETRMIWRAIAHISTIDLHTSMCWTSSVTVRLPDKSELHLTAEQGRYRCPRIFAIHSRLNRLTGITQASFASSLSADLQDGSIALAYLSRVLSCLALCRLHDVTLCFYADWPISITTWQALDRALLKLQRTSDLKISIKAKKTPIWEVLPFRCTAEFGQQILPRCIAQGATMLCVSRRCGLHDEPTRRRHPLERQTPMDGSSENPQPGRANRC